MNYVWLFISIRVCHQMFKAGNLLRVAYRFPLYFQIFLYYYDVRTFVVSQTEDELVT